jgi:DNA-binding ferritin-like protein (Dps family)
MEDTETRELLKSKEYVNKVFVLPEEYYEPLYKQIQANTALAEYFGELESEIFEIDSVLLDSLVIKVDNEMAV